MIYIYYKLFVCLAPGFALISWKAMLLSISDLILGPAKLLEFSTNGCDVIFVWWSLIMSFELEEDKAISWGEGLGEWKNIFNMLFFSFIFSRKKYISLLRTYICSFKLFANSKFTLPFSLKNYYFTSFNIFSFKWFKAVGPAEMGSAFAIALNVFSLFVDGKYGVLSINGVMGVFSILHGFLDHFLCLLI